MLKTSVTIYTDGACSPNPGIGGWGAVLISKEHNLRTELPALKLTLLITVWK
jgi:ribonuclease HI